MKEDVNRFYLKHIMNSKTFKHDVKGILDKLKQRFGKNDKEEWKSLISDLQGFGDFFLRGFGSIFS